MIDERLVNPPLAPAAPEELYFNEKQNAWILSHHRDVLDALRSADLSQAGPRGSVGDSSLKTPREKMDPAVFSALLSYHSSKLQNEITDMASGLLESLPSARPVDLVSQFIRPWCLASAIELTGVDPVHSSRLASLLSALYKSDAAPHDSKLKVVAKEANQELNRFFSGPTSSYQKSLFLGVAQTAAIFLASAWVALLEHLSEWTLLQTHPHWLPKATEELLRYAGPVHSLFRRVERDTNICGIGMVAGARLILRLASANWDPQQFADPRRLNIARGATGHLALSSGTHYCVGASLVRTMTGIATGALLNRCLEPELTSPVNWCDGTMLIWPSSLPALLGAAPPILNRTAIQS